MRIAILFGALALLAAGPAASQDAKLDDAVRRARAVLNEKLFDYPTARFLDVTAAVSPSPDGGVTFCGKLNSKNRMGAYSGFERFLVTVYPRSVDLWVGDNDIVLNAVCGSDLRRTVSVDYAAKLTAR